MTTPTTARVSGTLLSRLQFENGTLVKVDGMRPEYMDGHALIRLVRELAAAIQPDPEPQEDAASRHAALYQMIYPFVGDDGSTRCLIMELQKAYPATNPSSAGMVSGKIKEEDGE